jgi:hypothetical protein
MYSILEIKSSEIEGICEEYREKGFSRLTVKQLRSLSKIESEDLKSALLNSAFSKMVITFTRTDFIEDEKKFVEFLKELKSTFMYLIKNEGWDIIVLVSAEDKLIKYEEYFVYE